MDNHYAELEDDQLINLDYIENRNQEEPRMLDEHRSNVSSKNTYTAINNTHHNNNTTNQHNRSNNNNIQHNQHNQHNQHTKLG